MSWERPACTATVLRVVKEEQGTFFSSPPYSHPSTSASIPPRSDQYLEVLRDMGLQLSYNTQDSSCSSNTNSTTEIVPVAPPLTCRVLCPFSFSLSPHILFLAPSLSRNHFGPSSHRCINRSIGFLFSGSSKINVSLFSTCQCGSETETTSLSPPLRAEL